LGILLALAYDLGAFGKLAQSTETVYNIVHITRGNDNLHYLIVSDIHANLVAFQAVLADAPAFDQIWCLGDLVGYGPNPNECIERIQEFPHLSLAGNHDWAALGKLDIKNFNADARAATIWTQSELSPAAREYLVGLPTHVQLDSFTMAHASPREPVWEYVLDANVAYANFGNFSTPMCLVGHTHIPLIFEMNEQRGRCETMGPPFNGRMDLENRRMIINPGSVGQPRDGDPWASYAMLDTENMTWDFCRVPYAIEITQERMRARGLPRRLVDRLEIGR
jgi:predicted phosphodiesterase